MMSTDYIAYQKGLPNQLVESFSVQTNVVTHKETHLGKIHLYEDGWLEIEKFYSWNGASGPVINTRTTMIASLIHDALYELIRKRELDPAWKSVADKEYYIQARKAGMWKIRALAHWWALEKFGSPATKPSARRKTYYAP